MRNTCLHLLLLLIFPVLCFAQKVKVNTYDRYIKQHRIELEPVQLVNTEKNKIQLSFSSIASTLYLMISGSGTSAATIDVNNQAILLFANDSTITINSTSLQSFEPGTQLNSYKHEYYIRSEDLESLSRNEIIGLRTYSFKDFKDYTITGENAGRIKKLSSLFLSELKKANVLKTLKKINLQEVGQYVGDSVMFCSKVYGTRFFDVSENKPTILDIQPGFSQPLVRAVIWEQDRKNFNDAPEMLYNNKDVCLCGLVQLNNNLPQITIRNRNQIKIMSPISAAEAALFIGDTVTVMAKVASSKSFPDNENLPTLLNLGAAFPNQFLTVAIESKSQKLFSELPENFYTDKEIKVTGKVVLYRNKPQIVVQRKDQIDVLSGNALASFSSKNQVSSNKQASDMKTAVQRESLSTQVIFEQKETMKANLPLETMAKYPGGQNELLNFLSTHLQCPEFAETKEKKSVVLGFSVGLKGEISNIQIVQSAGRLYDDEAVRVFKKMPRWLPKIVNGFAVTERLNQTITFQCGIDRN